MPGGVVVRALIAGQWSVAVPWRASKYETRFSGVPCGSSKIRKLLVSDEVKRCEMRCETLLVEGEEEEEVK